MARPLRIAYPGAYYHVTSRGNEQRDVFKSQKDREKFLSYLESAVSQASRRFDALLRGDGSLRQMIEKMVRGLKPAKG